MSEIRNNVIAGGVGVAGSLGYLVYDIETSDKWMQLQKPVFGQYAGIRIRAYRQLIKDWREIGGESAAAEIRRYKIEIADAYRTFFKNMSVKTYSKYAAIGAFVGVAIYNISKNWFGDKA